MSLTRSVAESVSRRMGTVIRPGVHAAADYVLVASFVAGGALLWRRNRRAAAASLACGAAKLALIAATDYPGLDGSAKLVNFRTHGRLELGLAGVIASMPRLLSLEEGGEFFSGAATAMTVLHNLTDFGPSGATTRRKRGPSRAA